VNDNHNAFHDEKTGSFGFFEAINDQGVADALLDAAEAWVREQGMLAIRGPLNFSTMTRLAHWWTASMSRLW